MARLTLIITILITSLLLNIKGLEAQRGFSIQDRPILKTDDQGACWKSSLVGFTDEQIKALESLQQAFVAEAMPLRRELMSLRFELRHLIRDQNVPSKILFERQRKISELQRKLESLSLSYQIRTRSVLTKEQLEQLPWDCFMGMEVGFGMYVGTGKVPTKGSPW